MRAPSRGERTREQRLVDVEYLGEHEGKRTTVEDRVVERPEDNRPLVADIDDRES